MSEALKVAVSIPYSTIKILLAARSRELDRVSIPYSTIKILLPAVAVRSSVVSIPYSTIKMQHE